MLTAQEKARILAKIRKDSYGITLEQMKQYFIEHQHAREIGDKKMMEKIEYHLTYINFHYECGLLATGQYDKLPEVIKNWWRIAAFAKTCLPQLRNRRATITAFLKTTPAKSPHGIPLAPRSLKVTAVSARKRSLRWSIKGGFVQEMETVTLRERSPLFRFLSLNGEKRSAVLKSCQI